MARSKSAKLLSEVLELFPIPEAVPAVNRIFETIVR